MSIFHSGNPAACERDPNGCSNSERLLNLVDTHSSGCVRYAAASLPATVRSTLALSVSDVQAILDSYSGPAQHAFVCTLMPAIDFAGAQCTVELLGTLARAAESLNNWSRKALEAECFPVFDPKYFQEAVWSEVIRPYLKRASNEDLPTLDVAELVDRTLDLLRDRPQNPTQLLRLPLRALIEVLPTNDGDLLSKYTAFGGAVLDLQNNAVQSSFGSVRHEFRLRDVIRYAEPPLTLLELNLSLIHI